MSNLRHESESIIERVQNVRDRIVAAAERSNRSPDEIQLVAITKTHPAEMVKAAIQAGLTDLGENRVQEADEKIASVGREAARWHLVGHLQTNKARRAVDLFDCIHSLDSAELAMRLERLCIEEGREVLPVLIQIKLGGEPTKTGVDPNELPRLLESLKSCAHVRLTGLMTLPPYFENPDCARPFFKTLRELRDELRMQGHFGEGRGELSMGMTHDFEVAIEEGSTMVRVGTAIFGERS
ncbi:MAG TPA: YggS family pyridoxal phosphate-dependent enzyme [Pyrinomonadaceae bacterium]|nr:YggS family pyridoxal phosphate-dependent enzyme [Pyrinomonadaceae bacterium]